MPTPAALQPRTGHPGHAGILAQKRAGAWSTVCPGTKDTVRPGTEDIVRPAAEDEEFEARRRLCLQTGRREPLERVAALLASIARNNGYEGRDPSAIPDSLTSGFVADLLGLSIDSLAELLVELKEQGLITPTPSSGLRVIDQAGLERLAEAA